MTNSQKIITQLQSKYGTAVSGQYEAVRFQYYDYVRMPANSTTNRLTFFSNPIGAVDPTSGLAKTLEETNIRRSGELDERFAIMQVRTSIDVLPMSRQDSNVSGVTSAVVQGLTPSMQVLRNLNFQGVLSVNFGQKNFIQIEQPFQTCPPGYGPSIRTLSANGASQSITTYPPVSQFVSQSVDPRDVYVMDPAIFVEKGQTFGATIDFYMNNMVALPAFSGSVAAKLNVNIGVILDGYVIRPVQ
jgi:hypothetical protein